MRNIIPTLIIICSLIVSPSLVSADPLVIDSGDSIQSLLGKYKGKRVTVRVSSGEEMTGTVSEVNDKLVVLQELSGREFFDAAVALEKINAVIVRTKQ